MAATIEEHFDSRHVQLGLNPYGHLQYIIRGTTDYEEALTLLNATFPSTLSSIPAQSYRVVPLANDIWLGTVRYGGAVGAANEEVYQFDTGGGSQHITNSIATVARYAPSGGTAPNFQGAIGVGKNDIAGADIVVPTYSWNQVKYHPTSAVDAAYRATLFGLTGRVNNATWNGYAQCEVLFMGAAGELRGSVWEISYRFAAQPNMTGIEIGSITGIAKKGWEYLWVQYESDDDGSAILKVPSSVHIEQVYHYGDFSGLKL